MLKLFALMSALALATPAAAFDGIRVTLLGGDAISHTPAGPRAGTLIEAGDEVLLFDCAREVKAGLRRAGLGLDDITAIFLTRARPDNVAGCAELWEGSAQAGRSDPWEIWGPAGTLDTVRPLAAQAGGNSGVEPNEITENVVYQTEGVRVTAFVAERVPAEPAFGYRVDFRQRWVVIAADNRYSDTLARIARNAAVLVHQVALAAPEAADRSQAVREALALYASPEDAARTFRAAHPILAVYAYAGLFGATEAELIRRTRRVYSGPVEIGREKMVVEVENEVQVRGEPSEQRR
jgi:ribonuclease Z